MEDLLPYFWDGFKIGLYIAIPLELIRIIIFYTKHKDIKIFKIRTILNLIPIVLGIIFAFSKDNDDSYSDF